MNNNEIIKEIEFVANILKNKLFLIFVCLINKDQIDKVYFNGYEDKAEIERNKELIKHKNSILESK